MLSGRIITDGDQGAPELRGSSRRMAARGDGRAAWPVGHRRGGEAARDSARDGNLRRGRAGLSAEIAIRFDQAFGVSADTLTRMQAAHDLVPVRAKGEVIGMEWVAA